MCATSVWCFYAGLVIRSFLFSCKSLVYESERAKVRFTLFKVRIALFALFVKIDGVNLSCCYFCKQQWIDLLLSLFLKEQRKRMSSFTAIRSFYGHKKGKSMVKRTNLKRITLKKSESPLYKELIPLS